MPKLYKISLLVQADQDPTKWICSAVADQLEDGEELLKYMSVETTLEAELNPQETDMTSNTYEFPEIDLTEEEYFDPEDRAAWDEINKLIVYDFETVELDYGYDDDEFEVFQAGAEYAFRKMNEAFKIAGINAQVCYLDLVDGDGYILTQVDETSEDFVNRVLGNVTV